MELSQLKAQATLGTTFKYVHFWGHTSQHSDAISKACLSQWYEAPFVVDGETYRTAEHFMMAEKARLFDDQEVLKKILSAPSPGAAKALGRKVRGFRPQTWEANRFAIVVRGNVAKFSQNKTLGTFLRRTAPRILVEASPTDRIWGIGRAASDSRASDPLKWNGLNLLGFALMDARDQLRTADNPL